MTSGKKVFIVGPGFIGWNVLDLLVAEGYTVTALVRREEAAKDIKASGATPIIGKLDDGELIAHHSADSDIIIHAATADDLPSVKAVLSGIERRTSKDQSTIFIHTSGASVFNDGADGQYKGDTVYSDDDPAKINSVADSAPHREIDLAILEAKASMKDKAKMVIMVPPLIYGFNPKHARLTIQIPTLTRFAGKHGFAGHMGKGLSVISAIHVLDLARAYITVLHHLEELSTSDEDLANTYYFIESTGDIEPSWLEIATVIGEGLFKAGRIDNATPREIPADMYKDLFGGATGDVLGLNTRTRTVRLKKLGWSPTEKDWRSSFFEDELPEILKEDSSKFAGYGGTVSTTPK